MAKRVRVNKKNLRRLISAIENEGVLYKNQKVYFDMRHWLQEDYSFMERLGEAMDDETGTAILESDGVNVLKDCGSAACIGGYIDFLLKEKCWKPPYVRTPGGNWIRKSQAKFLGISIKKASALLIPWEERENQPNSFVPDDFNNVKREHAVKVLNCLLETGKVAWSVTGLESLEDYEAV